MFPLCVGNMEENELRRRADVGRGQSSATARTPRCFSVVNLPVTWLPESSAGSACEWDSRLRVDTSARPRRPLRAHVDAQVREPWRPRALLLQSKKIKSHLHLSASTGCNRGGELGQTRPGRKKKVFSVAPASRGNYGGDAIPGCRADRPAGHVHAERLN